jgi:hypothetical protein
LRGDQAVEHIPAIVVLEDLLVCHRRHSVVVKLEPPAVLLRLDERKVVSAVEVARVHENAMQLVVVRDRTVRRLVEELFEVDRERELVSVIDLDQRVLLHVILESSELEVEDRGEGLKDDTLLCRLQSQALRLVLVLPIQRFNRHILLERLPEVFQPLDRELDVCR